MALRFELLGGTKAPRRGLLFLERSGQPVTRVETPTFLKYTRRGLQPHLVPEMAAEVEGLPALTRVQLEDFLDGDEGGLERFGTGLRSLTSMNESELVVLDVLDPIWKQRTSKLTDKHISIPSDGGMRRLTPETFSRTVQALKPDIVVPPADYIAEPPVAGDKRAEKSVRRTALWLDKSVGHAAAILAPVMGARSTEQREAWAYMLAERDDICGYALNDTGLQLGLDTTLALAQHSLGLLDASKLRYMVGASAPDAALRAVLSGVDLVDSSYAFAVTEQGFASAYKLHGDDHGVAHVDLWNASMADDFRPLVEGCACFACRRHHRAYVHHLLGAHEMLATVLLQTHNLHCYQRFFADMRASIAAGSLAADAARFAARYTGAFDELSTLATQPFSPSSKTSLRRHDDPQSIASR
ncbi:hypothetical protein H4R24_001665 [Coemansia sp. RSA 988]|nr:hypothetical protein H4R24_001665 [Coemansia sp. RSA 988]